VSIIGWKCAHGEPLPIELACAEVVALGEADSNRIAIVGEGEIKTFGRSPLALVKAIADPNDENNHIEIREPCCCVKRVLFKPPRGGSIKLAHSSSLSLLGNRDRSIENLAIGIYSCDLAGNWIEESFHDSVMTIEALMEIIRSLQKRVADLEAKSVQGVRSD
jgi:hypothetical protein